jgi:hypothetical protein
MWKRLHVKHTLLLSGSNETCIFTTDFQEKSQISSFIKIRQVGAELFHAAGRTDMTKLLEILRTHLKSWRKELHRLLNGFPVFESPYPLHVHGDKSNKECKKNPGGWKGGRPVLFFLFVGHQTATNTTQQDCNRYQAWCTYEERY